MNPLSEITRVILSKMPRRSRDDEYIPIKIEGWNGKFVYDSTPTMATKAHPRNQQASNTNDFYGFNTEPIVLPPKWDGTFVPNTGGGSRYRTEDRNRSNDSQFYAYNTEPEVLPPTWSGKFVQDPNDVRIKPERNQSDGQHYHGYSNEPEVLPPEWNGRFEVDPNDIRIKAERNFSDARDYAEASRFRLREN